MIKIIPYGSDEYYQTLEMRSKILREPLGLRLEEADMAGEDTQIHIVAKEGEQLLGSLILAPLDAVTARMRQVAVSAEMQRKGVGKQLVLFCEQHARELGFEMMVLKSRRVAVPFYEMMGYTVVSEDYIEKTIPHCDMEKRL